MAVKRSNMMTRLKAATARPRLLCESSWPCLLTHCTCVLPVGNISLPLFSGILWDLDGSIGIVPLRSCVDIVIVCGSNLNFNGETRDWHQTSSRSWGCGEEVFAYEKPEGMISKRTEEAEGVYH